MFINLKSNVRIIITTTITTATATDHLHMYIDWPYIHKTNYSVH